jgi:hypothetical protein
LEEAKLDVFNIVRMAMYDSVEAPIVERVFRAASTPIRWPISPANLRESSTLRNGPALMWQNYKMEQAELDGPTARRDRVSNFAAWPEIVQAIAAVSVRYMATAPAETWADLKKLGLIHRGDTTIARRLFRP